MEPGLASKFDAFIDMINHMAKKKRSNSDRLAELPRSQDKVC